MIHLPPLAYLPMTRDLLEDAILVLERELPAPEDSAVTMVMARAPER